MKLTRNLKFNPALFALIPLVNVLFLVVFFFALSSRFVLQPGLAVTLPSTSFTLRPRLDAQIVSVTAAPVPVIYYRDQRVTLEELRQRLAQTSIKDRSVILKADKGTPYDLVVRITDEALKLGFSVVLASSSEAK
jgi:biopolymer transport protein ExbD